MNDDHDHDDGSTPDDLRDPLAANTPEPQRSAASVAPAAPVYIGRQDIADADDIEEVDVKVPEWAPKSATPEERDRAVVRVRGLTGEQRDEFEGSIITEKRDPNRKGKTKTAVEHRRMRAKLVVMSVVHPPGSPQAGQLVFDSTDVGWISAKSARALDRVFSKAQELAGLSDDDLDELVEGFAEGGNGSDGGSTST